MKKIIILVLMVLLAGCSKEIGNENINIILSDTTININIGDTKTLTYSITPANYANEAVSWKSSNISVVSVVDGNIKALCVGEAIISVEILDTRIYQSVKSTCKVTVNPKKVTGITLSKSQITIAREDTARLTYTIIPAGSTNTAVKWSSSNTNIATVDSNGLIKANSIGSCNVSAKTDDGGFEASCKVTVTSISVKGIYIQGLYMDNPLESQYPESNNLKLCPGDKLIVKINFNPQNADNKNLIWSTSDSNLATVKDGLFTITSNQQANGKVTITATSQDGGYKADLNITVADVFADAHGLSLIQSGNSYIVSFISSIYTSGVSFTPITFGGVYLTDKDNALIQIISDVQNIGGYKYIVRSTPITINGTSIQNFPPLKFTYTYKLPWMSDFATKEVFINTSLWSNVI